MLRDSEEITYTLERRKTRRGNEKCLNINNKTLGSTAAIRPTSGAGPAVFYHNPRHSLFPHPLLPQV
jgi:hypothetical protein